MSPLGDRGVPMWPARAAMLLTSMVLGYLVTGSNGVLVFAALAGVLMTWAAATGSAAALVGIGIGWLPFVGRLSIVRVSGLPDVTVQRVFAVLLVLVLAARVTRAAKDGVELKPALRRVGVVLAVGCFFLLQASIRSEDPSNALRFLLDVYVLPVAVFLALASVRWTTDEVWRAIKVAAPGAIAWVAVAAYEVVTKKSVFSGIDYAALSRGYVRPAGPFDNPAALGWLLGAFLVVVLGLYLAKRRTPMLLLLAIVFAIGIAMTLTRGAWLAALAGAMFVLMVLGERSRFRSIGIAVLTGAALTLAISELGVGSFLVRLSAEGTVLNRVAVWATALRLFQSNPLFGIGLGMYAVKAPGSLTGFGFVSASYAANIQAPHNSLLLLAVESGLLAAVAFSSALVMLFRLSDRPKGAPGRWAAMSFRGILLVSIVLGATLDVQRLSHANIVAGVIAGIMLGASGAAMVSPDVQPDADAEVEAA